MNRRPMRRSRRRQRPPSGARRPSAGSPAARQLSSIPKSRTEAGTEPWSKTLTGVSNPSPDEARATVRVGARLHTSLSHSNSNQLAGPPLKSNLPEDEDDKPWEEDDDEVIPFVFSSIFVVKYLGTQSDETNLTTTGGLSRIHHKTGSGGRDEEKDHRSGK